MEEPLSLDLKKQFPNAVQKDGVPANCLYRIPYAVKTHWQTDYLRISIQDHDAKDAYLAYVEIKAEKRSSFIISTTALDLFWLYLFYGGIQITPYPKGIEHNGFLDQINENEYALLYSPPREYQITVEPGLHVLFLFVVNSAWLQRHPIVEPTHYQKLLGYLQHQKDHYHSTKVLSIRSEIHKEILHLLTLPDYGEMLMDSKVYPHIIRLVLISREDLKNNGILVSLDMQEMLMHIRSYYKNQISEGHAPPITEVAEHFNIRVRQLRDDHKAFFGHSLQSFITEKRMEMAADLLLNSNDSITEIAYKVGYHLKVFQKQFKYYYSISPSEYRRLYNK